ncbi:hypothetical protein CAPTEDRAFT_223306 [Capitella teleta]|uniref:Uncharacterized protein n=1 Tax=Capitella teleta TaxID=283909 RepID=R7VDU6_CAPTE|nr:hypothetical protein CAPTEDRAFT_223306 [Capitella teleta]|eukprot:ELU16717.1 hypothetical protein CAPTEDRAFT_223306 [Capitella teleta]
MAICKPSSCAIVSTVFFALFGIAYIVGFAVPVWYDFSVGSISSTSGLWQFCLVDICLDFSHDDTPDWHKGTQAMMGIGMGCVILALIGHILWLCTISPSMTRQGASLANSCLLCGGITGVIGVIVYGFFMHEDVGVDIPNGYGYWLCAVSSGLMLLHGSIGLCWGCGSATPEDTTALAHAQVAQVAASSIAQQPQVVYVSQQQHTSISSSCETRSSDASGSAASPTAIPRNGIASLSATLLSCSWYCIWNG